MQIHKAWFTAVPAFVLVAACSDAPTAAVAPQAAQFEVLGTTTQVSECQAQIDALAPLTLAAPITSKDPERDRTGLLKKLSEATEQLAIGKNSDAAKKLTDYTVKVEQLVTGGKLDAAYASDLIAGANAAIACINGISA